MSDLSKSIVYIRNTCEACKNSNDAWMDPEVIKLADACEICAKAAQSRVSSFIVMDKGNYLCGNCYKEVSKYAIPDGITQIITYCEYCGKALNWGNIYNA